MKKFILFFFVCIFQMGMMAQHFHFGKKEQSRKGKSAFSTHAPQFKSVFNVMQRLDSVHSVSPSASGSPAPYKEVYLYDANQHSTGYYGLRWNEVTLMMDSDYKEIYVYDVNNQIQQVITWTVNNGVFDYFSRSNKTYNVNGNVILQVDDLWDAASASWLPNQQMQFSYNSQNEVTQSLTQIWNAGVQQYEDMSRVTYVYGPSGVTTELYEYFDSSIGTWTYSAQSTFTYNASGLLSSEEYQYYDVTIPTWVPSNLTSYTYNASMQLESALSSYYDLGTMTYISSDQVNYIYDTEGNVIQQVSLDPNDPFNPFYRLNFVFNNAFTFSDLILPTYLVQDIPDYFTHQLLNLNTETWDGMQWNQETNADLYYSQQTANAVTENISHEVKVFPNPAVDYLTIQTNGLNIPAVLLDQNGRCIERQNISGTQRVDVSHLSAGVYHWLINGMSYTFVK